MNRVTAAPGRRRRLGAQHSMVVSLATLVHATAVAVAIELGIRFLPLPTMAKVLGVALKPAPVASAAPPTTFDLTDRQKHAVRLARALMRRWPWGAGTCLRQSLVIAHLLRVREPMLRLGVRREGGIVEAHAWVEVPGMTNTGGQGFEPFEWA